MPTCAEVLASTLRGFGVRRMFGLPGGEILDFIEAARAAGIEFILTRHEATASFMADTTGQIQRRPGVCVSTLGPGAVNMVLGVANAYLDRSPLIAITASTARSAAPYTTHQNLDVNAVYRPFTKMSMMLDGEETEAKVAEAYRLACAPRMGPVHIALPSDVAAAQERAGRPSARSRQRTAADGQPVAEVGASPGMPAAEDLQALADELRHAERPVVILGLDLDPHESVDSVRRFVEAMGVPVFVTPKAKGMLSEDHPLFCGVCAGVAGDPVIVDFLGQADLLVGLGFEPVESDKLWHRSMKLVSIAPLSVAAGDFRPHRECVGEVNAILGALTGAVEGLARGSKHGLGPYEWAEEETEAFRRRLLRTLRPAGPPRHGLSPYELTLRLRRLFPPETIHVTDVGSIKFVTTQAWRCLEPLTFFESNGLSSMGYGFPGAMAAKLLFPDRPVLCTTGDGGFGMSLAEIETCVREGIHFVTVVYNDSSLSLIRVVQESRGYGNYGVDYTVVDFAAAAAALGVSGRHVGSMDELDGAVEEALRCERPAVIEVTVDPTEYRAHSMGS